MENFELVYLAFAILKGFTKLTKPVVYSFGLITLC